MAMETVNIVEPSSYDQLMDMLTRYNKYNYVLLGLMVVVLTYTFIVFKFAMRSRTMVFRRAFMNRFDEEHKNAKIEGQEGVEKAPECGYPDSGNGYFSKKLTYKQWHHMNCG